MNPSELPKDKAEPLLPENGGDFYLENGFVVFTEKHHRERGWCCHSGCRHCPYGEEAPRA